jgi:hypothetical protein
MRIANTHTVSISENNNRVLTKKKLTGRLDKKHVKHLVNYELYPAFK